jgi:hypothetical protein
MLHGRVERWRAHGRVRWQIPGFRRGPQSGSHGDVSSTLPKIPDVGFSPVRLQAEASFNQRLPFPEDLRAEAPGPRRAAARDQEWRRAGVTSHGTPAGPLFGICSTSALRPPSRMARVLPLVHLVRRRARAGRCGWARGAGVRWAAPLGPSRGVRARRDRELEAAHHGRATHLTGWEGPASWRLRVGPPAAIPGGLARPADHVSDHVTYI